MPCPTCNHTMHGLGECGLKPSEVESLLRETLAGIVEAQQRHARGEYPFEGIGLLKIKLAEAMQKTASRHFVCPCCGTVRTVTERRVASSMSSAALECGASVEEVYQDSPPMLVEAVKAADDTINFDAGSYERVHIGHETWAEVRRCIGRERP